MSKKVYDLLGIGIGPFNLGLAALCKDLPALDCLFLDQNESFNWHPGLMIAGTRLQVPFYADLVTLVNPKSDFSYMAYLHANRKMLRFAISENCFISRKEYNDYCRWVTNQLPNLYFSQRCEKIDWEKGHYSVSTATETYIAKHIVIGVGSVPFLPPFAKDKGIPHSSDYLYVKDQLLKQPDLTLVGSGQSAAEIFYDLLHSFNGRLSWFTRSASFFPMDYSKFALEKTSADYIDHFFGLHPTIKQQLLTQQDHLYKGINASLIEAIYTVLAEKNSDQIRMHPSCELKGIDNPLQLHFHHCESQKDFVHPTNGLILATGYQTCTPPFLTPIRNRIQWFENGTYDLNRNYSIDQHNQLFVQNADLHTHGFNSADLGLGPFRNAVILNTILGYEHFRLETNVTYQVFSPPVFHT